MSPQERQERARERVRDYDRLVQKSGTDSTKNEIVIPPGPRLGNVVVEVEHLSKAFHERLLIDDLSFTLPPGGIVGVVGPNGAGKSTLFRMMLALEKP